MSHESQPTTQLEERYYSPEIVAEVIRTRLKAYDGVNIPKEAYRDLYDPPITTEEAEAAARRLLGDVA